MNIQLEQGMLLAAVLFLTGLTGLLVRRNILFMLMSVEIMLNAGLYSGRFCLGES